MVAAGETVDGPVLSLDGPATIDGDVTGNVFVGTGRLRTGHVEHDVLVVDGDAVITGRVDGDVVTVTGRVTVADGGHVSGDVISRQAPRDRGRHRARRREATRRRQPVPPGFLIVVLIFLWISVTLSTAILGLVFLLVFARAAARRPSRAGGWARRSGGVRWWGSPDRC